MPSRPLGRIVRLQVQRQPLKTKGVRYDPSPILSVEEAAIGPLGMVGHHDGAWVVDAHHGAHPRSRGGGRRALSVGFTSHYEEMAGRFGSAPLGCAGENVVVETGGRVAPADLAGSIVIHAADGDFELTDAQVAAPCREFTSFLKGLDHVADRTDIDRDLAFLDGGTRGFILEVRHLASPVMVRVGDEVSVGS
jgi:hypothetical protein